MGFADFFRRLLPNQTIKIAGDASAYAFDTSQTAAEISLYAMFVVAEQVANIVSKCEYKIFFAIKTTEIIMSVLTRRQSNIRGNIYGVY